MDLEQIKNKVCQKHGMQNYTEFIYTCKDIKQLDNIIKEIVYLSQNECLKRASETSFNTLERIGLNDDFKKHVIKNSINNEINIIK